MLTSRRLQRPWGTVGHKEWEAQSTGLKIHEFNDDGITGPCGMYLEPGASL